MSVKKYFLLIILVVCSAVVTNAQPGGPGEEDPGGPQSGGVPVDGGLALLLAAGAGYGAKKAYEYKKNKGKSEK